MPRSLLLNNAILMLCCSIYLGTGVTLVFFQLPLEPLLTPDSYYLVFVKPVQLATQFFTCNWKDSALNIKNNGHTIQANYDGGSSIEVNGGKFNLLQYHFHAPSEHALNGKLYDMEVHFVHKAADGALAVIGVFFKEGAENKALKTVWGNMPTTEGEKKVAGVTISAKDLLPTNTSKYYHYMGSLTTPPCNEVVNWYVLENPIEASKAQVKTLADLFTINNRPVQPLNRRFVLTSEE